MPAYLALEGGAPRAFGIEGQQGLCTGAPRDWGNRLHSWKVHMGFHVHWVPEQSRGSTGIWVGRDHSSRKIWENRGWLWLVVGEGHWRQSSREYSSLCVSLEVAIFRKSSPTYQHWEAPGQTRIQVGSQNHPSVTRLPKDSPRHTATSNLMQRQSPTPQRDRNNPSHQWAGASPSH